MYHLKVWGHLDISLFFEEKLVLKHQIDEKKLIDILNDYILWKLAVFKWNIYIDVQWFIICKHNSQLYNYIFILEIYIIR